MPLPGSSSACSMWPFLWWWHIWLTSALFYKQHTRTHTPPCNIPVMKIRVKHMTHRFLQCACGFAMFINHTASFSWRRYSAICDRVCVCTVCEGYTSSKQKKWLAPDGGPKKKRWHRSTKWHPSQGPVHNTVKESLSRFSLLMLTHFCESNCNCECNVAMIYSPNTGQELNWIQLWQWLHSSFPQ